MNSFPIFILCGYSAAGKTTLSKRLADDHGYKLITSEQVTDGLTREAGYIRTRDFIATIGTDNFMQAVSADIVQRVRRDEDLQGVVLDASGGSLLEDALKAAFPEANLVSVAIQTHRELRTQRIMGRMGGVERGTAEVELDFRDAFLNNVGVAEAMETALIVVDNTPNVEASYDQLMLKLKEVGLIR